MLSCPLDIYSAFHSAHRHTVHIVAGARMELRQHLAYDSSTQCRSMSDSLVSSIFPSKVMLYHGDPVVVLFLMENIHPFLLYSPVYTVSSKSSITTLTCPFIAAWNNGVAPVSQDWLTWIPCSFSRMSTTFSCPYWAAINNGVQP